MHGWLEGLPAYRTTLGGWMFVCSGGIGGYRIALFTVGFQAMRAAMAGQIVHR